MDDHPLLHPLTTAPRTRLGQFEGQPQQVFGQIEDAAVDAANRVYVLDAHYHEVRVFDDAGRFVAAVGSEGEGPGQFVSPRAVATGKGGIVYVAGLRGVHLYGWSAGALEYDHSLWFAFDVHDLCVLNDRLYVHGVWPETTDVIHAIVNDTVTASFGDVYAAPNPLSGFRIRPSRLACVPDLALLTIGARSLVGEVFGYATDGSPRWITAVEGFMPIESVHKSTGGASIRVPERGYDRLYSLTALRGTWVLAQVAYISRRDYDGEREYTDLLSFVIDAARGEIVALGKDVPRVIASNESIFVSIKRDPYPTLGIHAW